MSFVKISELPAAASAAATDQIETNQGGTSRRLTVGQIAAHVAGNLTDTTITGTAVISANSATNAFRITQTGAGNALVVEDAANPDSTPFVVDASGQVTIGKTTANSRLNVASSDNSFTNYPLQVDNASNNYGAGFGAYGLSNRVNALNQNIDYTIDVGRNLIARTADTERMRITSTGNVAIGSPTGGVVARLDVIGPSNLQSLRTLSTDSVSDQNFEANLIDYNVAGTDTLTASKNHTAFRVDVDSTASGGTTVNEHILRGVYTTIDVGAAGISQSIIGSQSVTRTLNTSGTVNDMYGAFNNANVDPGVGGTVSTAFGSMNQAYAGGAGTIGTIYGSRNEAVVEGTATAGVTTAYGTFNEIEIDGNTLTNAYATESIVNADGGVTTNAYLYHGDYQISGLGVVTNAWGLYLTGSTKNYMAGQILTDAGSAAAPVFTRFTDTNTGIFFPAADTIAFAEGGVEAMRIDASGNVGIGTSAPTALLDINSNTLRLRTAKTPASATDTGNAGDIAWDANYIYVCTATNTWKRTALSTW